MKLKSLSIATFNLLNFNLPGLPVYSDRDGWSEDAFELKVEHTARTLLRIDADVVGFQELWHADALARVLDRDGLADKYDMIAPEDATGGRIVCAAIARKGLLQGTPDWIEDFPEAFLLRSSGEDAQTPEIEVNIGSFSRPVLHFTIRPREDHDAVHVYVCHFKSKAPTRIDKEDWFEDAPGTYKRHREGLGAALSTVRRTAEAAALRFLLSNQMDDTRTPVIVLGDINDGQLSNTQNILTGQPRFLVGDSRGGGDTSLYTAQTLQEYRSSRDVYYTHIFEDMMESLDHILVSEEFYDNSRRRVWMFDEMVVLNDHLSFADHAADGTNDHGIVRASFKYRPIRAEAESIAAGPA